MILRLIINKRKLLIPNSANIQDNKFFVTDHITIVLSHS
uniref:Uncharacterized protein n=1 Tax=Arundo donax TaxID=35708 RepID=A0A0A9E9V2_ARUDO